MPERSKEEEDYMDMCRLIPNGMTVCLEDLNEIFSQDG